MDLKTINGRKTILKYEVGGLNTALSDAIRKGISLDNADLIGMNLSGMNLSHANLAGANLTNANLEDAILYSANLAGANLKDAILYSANLACANLEDAILYSANLACANLKDANLKGAKLEDADLSCANLIGANLEDANLIDANLKSADIIGATLRGADISGANLYGANLERAKNIPFIPLACPSKGAFVAWKKVDGYFLVKLQIPEDARRTSATTRKCRCDMAKVLDITSLDGEEHYDEVTNNNYKKTIYKVGEMVYPDSFDENRWSECSHGIHFFVDKKDAIEY